MAEKLENILNTKDEGILNKYAQILVNVRKVGVKSFTYLVPKDMQNIIKVGQGVLVPFGKQGNVIGVVVQLKNHYDEAFELKNIIEILDENALFSEEYIKLIEWCADYYCSDVGTVLNLALPAKFLKQSKRIVTLKQQDFSVKLNLTEEKIVEYLKNKNLFAEYKTIQRFFKVSQAKFAAAIRKLKLNDIVDVEFVDEESSQKTQTKKYVFLKSKDGANKRQLEILNYLQIGQEVELIEFEKLVKTTRTTILKMRDLKFVDIVEKEIYRNPLQNFNIEKDEKFPQLSDEQNRAYQGIKERIQKSEFGKYLLFGVTASGKTEVYFNLIRDTIKKGKNVLFIVPEIALASQLTMRIAKRFGIDSVAIWHSSISEGERYDVWQKLRQDEIKILVGARSCVFAPLKNVGLIIVDEEHDSGLKQTSQEPRYNANEVAQELSKIYQIPLVVGSATPDVSTYYSATISNNIFKLEKRFNDVNLANVVVVDMKEEFHKEKRSIFSRLLVNGIAANLREKKQTLILLNRRGFSTHIQCLGCGEVIKCPNCDVSLVYHKNSDTLKCHLCDYTQKMITKCPKCGSTELKITGIGTQKIEESLLKMFPEARIGRIDSDVMASKHKHIEILEQFMSGEIDILIGTQMIAKGLDNSNVTLVGVIDSDTSFLFPDYQATERGFQLLMQVAGRAGRGEFEGKVVFQTNNPEYYALTTAKKQDYLSFYREEIDIRKSLNYPPFSQLFKFVISAQNEQRAKSCVEQIAEYFKGVIKQKQYSDGLILLGPVECVISKINSEYRFQFIIKNMLGEKGHKFISKLYKTVKVANDIKLVIDVNPVDMI